MTSPNSGTGYDKSDREKGGNGYMPISLQYNDHYCPKKFSQT